MFDLPHSGVVQVLGADAEKVINNLCTNDVKQLGVGYGCEAFVTNVRGWCVEHGFILKRTNEILIVGQLGNPTALCAHIDRYIVREDAKLTDQSDLTCVLLLGQLEADAIAAHFANRQLAPTGGAIHETQIAGAQVIAVSVDLLAEDDVLLIAELADREALIEALSGAGIALHAPDEFERLRIASGWPLAGREISEKSIPQELDRDPKAISFTKGCYLGQETIARLDAIGQLQKKICLVRIDTTDPIEPAAALLKDNQPVGQTTSIAFASSVLASSGDYQLALAYLRRGNFEAGLQLTCNGAMATVLPTRT